VRCRAAFTIVLSCCLVPAAASGASQGMTARLDGAVRSQRMLLLDLDAMPHAKGPADDTPAWRAYDEKEQMLRTIETDVQRELAERAAAGSGAFPTLTAFLDEVEKPGRFADGDLLTFDDLAHDLLADLRDVTAPRGDDVTLARTRLEQLVARIERIRGELDAEAKPLPQGAKGAGTRPKWRAFLSTVGRSERDRIESEKPSGAKGKLPAIVGYDQPMKTFVLTFDDGPHADRTERVRAILQASGIPACFFQVGNRLGTVTGGTATLGKAASASRNLLAAGYPIGNHSFTHRDLRRLRESDRRSEIDDTNALLRKVGVEPVVLFRPPYGSFDAGIAQILAGEAEKNVLWNVDSLDWKDPVPASIVARVVAQAKTQKRGIILFHDIHERTVLALPDVIAGLRNAGFTFGSCASMMQ
jgi:peptidoglycan/xylan/chitin deacetylase (PgdA/CDA1 family)